MKSTNNYNYLSFIFCLILNGITFADNSTVPNITSLDTIIQNVNGINTCINGTIEIANNTAKITKNTIPTQINGIVLLVNGTAITINGTVLMINGQVPLINGTTVKVNEKTLTINGTVLIINGTSPIINSTTTTVADGSYIIIGNTIKQTLGETIAPIIASEDGVCQSITIINDVNDFKKLEGCRVIEGFLHIIDMPYNTSYDNFTFPLLTEITYYVSIVHARGLKSLGKLFPNLCVIRGDRQLLKGYSLIIYENPDLEELSLQSLKNIGRGAVRIDSNPKLCYSDTIDWAKISTHASIRFHYIQNNKRFNCTTCPAIINQEEVCAVSVNASYSLYNDKRILCWNTTMCQRVCPVMCRNHGCNLYGECCHTSCLGGCTQPNSARHCNVCKYYKYNGLCIDECPDNTFAFRNRRCLTPDACKQQPRSIAMALHEKEYIDPYPYFPFEGKCIYECPLSYTLSRYNVYTTCVRTTTEDLRRCPGGEIKTKSDLTKFKNCYHIAGSLTINSEDKLNSDNLIEGLRHVRIIEGYLAIIGTYGKNSPQSLKSLPKLYSIRGRELYDEKYAMFFLFNESFFSFNNRTIEIHRGSLFFAMNPSLCSSRIRKFQQVSTELSGSCCDTVDIGNDERC